LAAEHNTPPATREDSRRSAATDPSKESVVLVTGGAGYIGSHACKALARAGYRVVVFDDLSAGHRAAVRYGPLVEGDVTDTRSVREALRRYHVSAVMHFAALLDVGESVREPAKYFRNNVAGALSVLEAMTAESVRRFVFSSTCATYGEPLETPIAETHRQQPINSYGESKLAVERALPHFERGSGLKWVSLRYFNAAGADPDGDLGEDHSPEIHLIPRAIDAAVGGTRLQVFGDDYPTPDGTCLRDYVHVSDLADAHVMALQSISRAGPSDAYNLGTGRPHSVREVISAVERITGREVPWTVAPRRAGDPSVLCAAPGKAQSALGWTPHYSELDSIVETAWVWHRTHPHGYRATAHS
jgi:UDP-glucose-4-epimerase GalE